MIKRLFILCLIILTALVQGQQSSVSKLAGPYLGQKTPGTVPELFAVGYVTTKYHEHSSPSFSPSGDEVFWSAYLAPLQSNAPQVILTMKLINGQWTMPAVASFSGRYDDGGPRFSPDGRKLYFYSKRPLNGDGNPKDSDIWYIEKTKNGWSEPVNMGSPINTEKNEAQPSLSNMGALYFIRDNKVFPYTHCIYYSELSNGKYVESVQAGPPINIENSYAYCPYIAPDESYLLFASNRKNPDIGFADIYICHKLKNGSWSEPIFLECGINSDDNDRFPAVSPDGKFLFFNSKRKSFKNYYEKKKTLSELLNLYDNPGNGLEDVYWVDTACIK